MKQQVTEQEIILWKKEHLDTKSKTFCGAKWLTSTIWLYNGTTSSCHHNPPHPIDLDQAKQDPGRLNSTDQKIKERQLMREGKRPEGCQYCWVIEDSGGIPDRVVYSNNTSNNDDEPGHKWKSLDDVWESKTDIIDPRVLEVSFDRTCQLACSYCCPEVSSSWARDIRNHGAYENITTDDRNLYKSTADDRIKFKINESNPYADAFFDWWEKSLKDNLRILRLTGGEPMMSGYTWKFLDWLIDNPDCSLQQIHITTNLAYDNSVLEKLFDKVKQIKPRVILAVSGESIGATGDYIRDGFNWSQWETNMESVAKSNLFTQVEILTTMGALGATGFVKFLEWLEVQKKKYGADFYSLYINIVRFPTFQNVVVLPQTVRNQLSLDISNFVNNSSVFNKNEIAIITRFANYLKDIKEPHRGEHNLEFSDLAEDINISGLRKDFKSFFQQYDLRRDKNFTEIFPKLTEWYNTL